MPQSKGLQKWNLITPSEENRYCFFPKELEDDPLVLFHITPKGNLDSITTKGFLSAEKLGEENGLPSVSYAMRSSSCLAHIGNHASEDMVIFAARFSTLEQRAIKVNPSDVHVFDQDIQPVILGYGEIPKGYRAS